MKRLKFRRMQELTGKEFREELEKHAECRKPGYRGDCKTCKFVIVNNDAKYCLIKQCEKMREEMKIK